MRVHFSTNDDGTITMLARAEGAGAMIGDSLSVIKRSDQLVWPKGLTFDELAKAKAGVMVIAGDGESYTIDARK